MAEGIIRHLANEHNQQIIVDSCGTGGWHAGENPDARAISTMKKHGIDISKLTARKFQTNDFDQFDLILVMDTQNYEDVISLAKSPSHKSKVKLILDYLYPNQHKSVKDPWYGTTAGFEDTYQELTLACTEVLKAIRG